MSLLKADLARSSGLIFLATFLANLIVFVVDLFISNILGPESFGTFRTVFYLFTFMPLLLDLGISMTLTKYIAEYNRRKKERIGFLVRYFMKIKTIALTALVLCILLFREHIAIIFLNDASLSYLVIPGALLSILCFFNIFQNIVLGYQEFKLFAKSQFLVSATSAILAYIMSFFGLFYLVIGWSLGYLIGNVFNIRFFFKN